MEKDSGLLNLSAVTAHHDKAIELLKMSIREGFMAEVRYHEHA